MKKIIMCLMATSLLLTNTIAIQAKDTKEIPEQKTLNEMTAETGDSDMSTNNSVFEDGIDSAFDRSG